MYDFYIDYFRGDKLYPFINTKILDAIINYEPGSNALNGYDTSIFNNKEKLQKLVYISIRIKNYLIVVAKCKKEINKAMNAYSGDLEDLYFSENGYE